MNYFDNSCNLCYKTNRFAGETELLIPLANQNIKIKKNVINFYDKQLHKPEIK